MAAHGDAALHGSCDEPAARRREVAAAGHRGDAVVARRHLSDDDAAVRSAALGALARIGDVSLAELATGVSDPSPAVRRRALELSFRCGLAGSEVADVVRAALSDEAAEVVEAACFALGELGDREGVPVLCAVAGGHADPLCRESAVAALGAIGDVSGLPAVLVALGDRPAVRRRAVLALAPFEGDEVEAALARAREDRDWQVRQAAEDLSGLRAPPGPARARQAP